MTALNLEELRAAAEAAQKANASKGTWEHAQDREGIQGVGNDFSSICLFGYLREDDHVWIPFDDAETFAAFIAAANPETVLALIERAEQADVLEAELRPEVWAFARKMEAALKAHDGQYDGNSWKSDMPEELLEWVARKLADARHHAVEARKYRCAGDEFGEDHEMLQVFQMAVHIANYAMMAADQAQPLVPALQPKEGHEHE